MMDGVDRRYECIVQMPHRAMDDVLEERPAQQASDEHGDAQYHAPILIAYGKYGNDRRVAVLRARLRRGPRAGPLASQRITRRRCWGIPGRRGGGFRLRQLVWTERPRLKLTME